MTRYSSPGSAVRACCFRRPSVESRELRSESEARDGWVKRYFRRVKDKIFGKIDKHESIMKDIIIVIISAIHRTILFF